jgi:iron(III) transport system substrate-binding protein
MNKYFVGVLVILFALATIYYLGDSLMPSENEVIVYVSHDQDYSEPILKDFEKDTGIKVKAVYDTEATKTVGLVNRLIAEKNRPQADVFWNNELSRTILLKEKGVLSPYKSSGALDKPDSYKDPDGYWTGFAARARVMIYNTQSVKETEAPKSINDLLNPMWRGKVGIANPALGTTGDQVAALFSLWGDDVAKRYFTGLKGNDVKVVESNGMVKNQVAAGELYMGLTDTDDANDAIQGGKSVAMVYPDQREGGIGTLLLPNSVMLIKGAPHQENAKKLIDYLLSSTTEEKLSRSKAVQIPLGKGVPHPDNVPSIESLKLMNVSQYDVYSSLNRSQEFITQLLIN